MNSWKETIFWPTLKHENIILSWFSMNLNLLTVSQLWALKQFCTSGLVSLSVCQSVSHVSWVPRGGTIWVKGLFLFSSAACLIQNLANLLRVLARASRAQSRVKLAPPTWYLLCRSFCPSHQKTLWSGSCPRLIPDPWSGLLSFIL